MATQGDEYDDPSATRRVPSLPPRVLPMLNPNGPWRDVAGSLGTQPAPPDSAVLSGVVNDLCGPLSDLLAFTSLLAENIDVLPPEMRSVVHLMQQRALLLQSRSENLSCAVAVWDDRFQIHPQPVDLLDVTQEISPAVMPLISQRKQRLETITEGDSHRVHADPRRLAQIIVNLIQNASRHASERSLIRIHLSTRETGVRVAVADRGPGIEKECLPRLFELGHQPSSAVATGRIALGLAVVRAITVAHCGRVGARNRRGGGACVWFELPRIASPDGVVAAAMD